MIQKAKEGLRNLMEIAIQFQTKNLMEKGRFNKIVQKYKTFRIQKFKEKMRRKKYLMYLIQAKTKQTINKIKGALEAYNPII